MPVAPKIHLTILKIKLIKDKLKFQEIFQRELLIRT